MKNYENLILEIIFFPEQDVLTNSDSQDNEQPMPDFD